MNEIPPIGNGPPPVPKVESQPETDGIKATPEATAPELSQSIEPIDKLDIPLNVQTTVERISPPSLAERIKEFFEWLFSKR